MSKDFFKVKKGLNIKPSDPSALTGLEDGDLIIDSTDGNKLKKYNSTKVGFEDVTTPGSAQALNLLTDASFETEDAQFDIAPAGQLFSFEEHGVGAGLYTPTNLQYLQVQNASANTLSISRDENHSADLQGKQGLLTIWLKTSSEGFKVGVRVDGVDPTQDSIDQLSVRADGTWRKYELPFVFGSTSIGYKVYSDTSQVNAIDIDNVYMGLSPDGYFNNINNVDTDWISYTPSTQGYGTITDVNFYYKRVGESLKVRGYFTTGSVTAVEAQLGLPNSLIISDKNGVDTNVAGSYAYSSSTTANGGLILTTAGDSFINFTTTGVFGAGTNSATTPANANATSGSGTRITLEFEVPIQGWATGRTDATNQQTELTAATANDLVARFDNNGSTVTEVSSNYSGWYDSITRNGLGVVTIDYTSLGLTSLPSYKCDTIDLGGTNNYGCRVNGISTTSATFIFYNTANNRVDTEFTFTLEKTGADVNKSATIVGKFANIEEIKAPLTAATANELTARIDNQSTSGTTLFSQNYDFIDSISRTGTGQQTINFKSGIFSVPPAINITAIRNTGQETTVNFSTPTANSVFVKTYDNNGNFTDTDFDIHVSKQGADVNTDLVGTIVKASDSAQEIADIVRTDIISSDLVQVEAAGNSGQTITANVDPVVFDEISDNFNAWDGSTFVAPKQSVYHFTGNARTTANLDQVYILFVSTDNGVSYSERTSCNGNEGSSLQKNLSCTVFLNAGDRVQVRSNTTSTLIDLADYLHNLQITELPDTASIVENLNQNPRVSLQDQYSEIEIEWGRWNGQQLYRRCFTLNSDVTTIGEIIATWDTNLNLVNANKFTTNDYFIPIGVYSGEGTSTAFSYCQYNQGNGRLTCNAQGITMFSGTTACVDYTK